MHPLRASTRPQTPRHVPHVSYGMPSPRHFRHILQDKKDEPHHYNSVVLLLVNILDASKTNHMSHDIAIAHLRPPAAHHTQPPWQPLP